MHLTCVNCSSCGGRCPCRSTFARHARCPTPTRAFVAGPRRRAMARREQPCVRVAPRARRLDPRRPARQASRTVVRRRRLPRHRARRSAGRLLLDEDPPRHRADAGRDLRDRSRPRPCRHRGLGRFLTIAGLDWLTEQGITEAMLYVESDNDPARALYDKLGFTTHHAKRWWRS